MSNLEINNKRIGSVNISLANPTSAKDLAKFAGDEMNRPVLKCVMVEANATTGDINLMAANCLVLGVITNDKENMRRKPSENDKVYQALFPTSEWKQICDYARKEKVPVEFEIYKRTEEQKQDTMVAVLGDSVVTSKTFEMPCVNWRTVLPKNVKHHFTIHPEDVKGARKFIGDFKIGGGYEKKRHHIFVSFYRGSNVGHFDYYDIDFDIKKHFSFRLTEPSDITIGVCYKLYMLKGLKFSGFGIQEPLRATEVECEGMDYVLVMPSLADEYVFDVKERENVIL